MNFFETAIIAAIGGLGFWLPCIAAVWSHDGRLGIELFVGLICPLVVAISWYLARRRMSAPRFVALSMLAGVWILLPFGFLVAVAPTLSKVSISEGFDTAIYFIPKFLDSPVLWIYRLGIHWGVILSTATLLGAAYLEKIGASNLACSRPAGPAVGPSERGAAGG